MNGTRPLGHLGVPDHPFYALTDAVGTFQMRNLHAGGHGVEVAHPGEVREWGGLVLTDGLDS